ncbi:hypothetical protein Acr_28g0001880 [Actinidia rufa]|uniref:Uncharacterized protein n=1 Tax=Actinidia rufa TaxID=165716 RepID=A0A7J0H8Q3_9ERIC|nr:hypothetical protein Acr_28g0001880 [Actinidia rufa]
MKRVWRISDAAHAQLFLHTHSAKPKTLICQLCAQTPPPPNPPFPPIINLFSDNWRNSNTRTREDICATISQLRDELIHNVDNGDEIARILEEKRESLFRSQSEGSGFLELLKQLRSWCLGAFNRN